MQTTEKPVSIDTAASLPPLGPNKIAQAMEDYDLLASELRNTKTQMLEYVTLANKLQAENEAIKNQLQMQTEFMTRQVDIANARADILGTTLTAMRTSYSTIREVFARCETEALAAGVAAAAVGEQTDRPPEKTEPIPTLGPVPGDEVPSSISAEDHRPLGDMVDELEKYAPKRSPANYQLS